MSQSFLNNDVRPHVQLRSPSMNLIPRHSISSPVSLSNYHPQGKMFKSYPDNPKSLLIDTSKSLGHNADPQLPLASSKYPATPWSSSFIESNKPRRLWVRTPLGNPTTILAYSDSIVDDLKSLIIDKYPNTIGRYDDAANLVLKLDLLTTRSQQALSASTSTISPNVKGRNNGGTTSGGAGGGAGENYAILEPDQNVWQLMDTHYPHGMTMKDALIIDVYSIEGESPTDPTFAKHPHQYLQHGRLMSYENRGEGFDVPLQYRPQYQQQQQLQQQQQQQQQQQHYAHQPTPILRHFPINKPHLSGQNHLHFVPERSVSPSTLGTKDSSVLSAQNRSNSTTATSPVHKAQPNPQAVLLLPKNFTLSSTSGSSYNNNNSNNNNNNNNNNLSNGSAGGGQGKNLSLQKAKSAPIEGASSGNGTENQSISQKNQVIDEENTEAEGDSDIGTGIMTPSPSESLEASTLKNEETGGSSTKEPSSFPLSSTPLKNNTGKGEKSSEQISSISKTIASAKSNTKSEKSDPALDKVLPSISVLVVEDNAINQAILGAFLRKRKIHYQIAKNGQEAIDKWKKGGFHLVLMDIQLPVKSGIEATKEIRHLERLNRIGVFDENDIKKIAMHELKEEDMLDSDKFRSPVIIVALTASSNSSVDRKNALTAGCNDYLTKPVNLVWLQNKITEWGCMQALIDFEGWKSKNNWNSV